MSGDERAARSAYMAGYRKTDAGKAYMVRQRRRAKAYQRAYRALADRYPAEFGRLLAVELKTVNAEGTSG